MSSLALAGVDVAEGVSLRAHANGFDVHACEAAHKADEVAVALAGIFAVCCDGDVVNSNGFTLVAVKQFFVGEFEFADGFGHRVGVLCRALSVVVVVNHRQAAVIHKVQLEALEAKAVGEGDLVGFVEGARRAAALGGGAHTGAVAASGLCGVTGDAQALQFAHALAGLGGLLYQAVCDQEYAVGATGGRGGEDDFVAFVDRSLTLGEGAGGRAHRRGGFAQGFEDDLLDFIGTSVGCAGGTEAAGDRGLGGTGRDTGDVLSGELANEFNRVAVIAVAADLHVSATHTVQAFQCALQGCDQFVVGQCLGNADSGAVGAFLQGEAANEVNREFEFELGVDLDGLGRLGRHLDALVDVDQQVLHLQGQAIDAHHSSAAGGGLQAGEAAGVVFGVGNQGQAKVDPAQAQTGGAADEVATGVVKAAVDTGKGAQGIAANGDEFSTVDGASVG